jgi:hypothetical protein
VFTPALVVLCVGVFFAPNPVLAQDDATRAALILQELRYQAARDAYDASLTARLVVESEWEAALDSVQAARQGSDQAAYDRASERHMLLAQDLTRMDRRVQQASDSLEAARSDYLQAMDARLGVLLELQDSAGSRLESQRYQALIEDLENEYRALEASSEILVPELLVSQGVLAYNPRDTPSRLRNKIEVATRRIEVVQIAIDEADDRIEGLERRQRLQRQQENFLSPLGRFDDTRIPVGPPGQSRSQGQGAVSDSTGVRTAPQSLDDQLEAWQALRSQLETRLAVLMRMRDELSSYLGSSDAVSARRSGRATAGKRVAA